MSFYNVHVILYFSVVFEAFFMCFRFENETKSGGLFTPTRMVTGCDSIDVNYKTYMIIMNPKKCVLDTQKILQRSDKAMLPPPGRDCTLNVVVLSPISSGVSSL